MPPHSTYCSVCQVVDDIQFVEIYWYITCHELNTEHVCPTHPSVCQVVDDIEFVRNSDILRATISDTTCVPHTPQTACVPSGAWSRSRVCVTQTVYGMQSMWQMIWSAWRYIDILRVTNLIHHRRCMECRACGRWYGVREDTLIYCVSRT